MTYQEFLQSKAVVAPERSPQSFLGSDLELPKAITTACLRAVGVEVA